MWGCPLGGNYRIYLVRQLLVLVRTFSSLASFFVRSIKKYVDVLCNSIVTTKIHITIYFKCIIVLNREVKS